MGKLKHIAVLALLFCCCSFSACCASEAADPEPVYQITETELTRLESNLSELSTINNAQLKTLTQQRIQLQESEQKLTAARNQSEQLQTQIYSLQKDMEQQRTLLEIAKESSEKSAKEARSKIDKANRDRTIAWIIAGLLLVANKI